MTTEEELKQLTVFINSTTFHILPIVAQQPTLDKQKELAKQLLEERIHEYILPLINEYGLGNSFTYSLDGNSPAQKDVTDNINSSDKEYTRSAPLEFSVIFPDGTAMQEDSAKDTFVKALKKIGLERVAQCKEVRKFAGYDLVGKIKRDEPGNWQRFVDGWWIYTFIDNERKASTLKMVSLELNLDLKVFLNGEEYDKDINSNKTDSFGIKVTFPDGTVIHEPQAKQTFIKVLQKIGLSRIYKGKHGIEHCGFRLVGKEKRTDYHSHGNAQTEIDGFYIYTLVDNDMKVVDLKKLNEYFNLNLLIERDSEEGFIVVQKQRASYDKTTYSLNGGDFLNKRRFALALVRKYVEDNPDSTYEDLKEVFVPEIISGRGVVRSIMDLDDIKQEEAPKRYMMDDEDLITLKSDDIITVCSQWNPERIEKMVNIAEALGYTVESQARE